MKKILFLTLLLCTVLGATIPMSAKACCCCNDNHQNYDTSCPSATADPIQQAEEQGYQKAQEDYHKEAGFQEWRAEKARRDSDTDLNIFVPILLMALIFSLILVIWI